MSADKSDADRSATESLDITKASTDRRPESIETTNEFDLGELFRGVAQELSPAFMDGRSDEVQYVADVALHDEYEITPGEFVDVECTFAVNLDREYVAEDDEVGKPESDVEREDDATNLALLDRNTARKRGTSGVAVDTLTLTERRSHKIAALPEQHMAKARELGLLEDDGDEDEFTMATVSAYVITLGDGTLEREFFVEYEVNGSDFDAMDDIGEIVDEGLASGEVGPDERLLEDEPEYIALWDSMLFEKDDEAMSQIAAFEAMQALRRQLGLRQRINEYAADAARILWQVTRLPVPGFTDKQTPNRL